MPDVSIALGDISTGAGVRMLLDADQVIAGLDDDLPVNTATFELSPYVVVNGVRVADAAGARIDTTAGVDSVTPVYTPIDPVSLFPDAHAHWIPDASYLAAPADGGRRWWPIGGVHDSDHPRISLYSIAGATGAGLYNFIDAPYIHVEYSYQGNGRKMARPAMVFENDRARAKIDPEAVFDDVTLAVTAVLHPSDQQYYGIFEATADVGEPLVLRYTHGRLDLFQNELRVLSHETNKPSAYPVILLISLNATTEVGRMLCLDQTRTTRQFATADMDFISLLGSIGALGQGTVDSPFRYGAEMDLLDLAIWNHAMDWPELESTANLLALAYT